MGLVVALVAIYLVVVTLLWAFQERITFPAPRAALPDPAATVGGGETIELRMADGTALRGWFLPATEGGDKRSAGLLWFYGNGETIAYIWPTIREFRPPHAALLVIDYPGYGASGGRATEASIYEAAELAYNALINRPEIDPQRVYVYGRSLGSAPATRLAAEHRVAGLILESPFTNARAMARQHYRLVPQFLVRLELDNLAAIRRIRSPLLVLHGTADRLVPMEMGRELAEAAPGPVEFVMIEGSGHNDTYELGGRRYKDKMAAFVRP